MRALHPTWTRSICGAIALLVAGLALAPAAWADEAPARGNWLHYGLGHDNQRHSLLTEINRSNVRNLRPVWAFSTESLDGVETTPLIEDGVMYVSAAWAHVYALDARTGRRLWHYAPSYPRELQGALCCGPVNRGVALWAGLVFVATLDARLVALDKRNGRVVWEQAFGDFRQGVTSTGAPLVVKDKVIVGMAGGEFGVRGYLCAFQAANGATAWKRYTVPAPGEPGSETWSGETWRKGGGSTWQTGAYDPELDLLYWGTGNPAPWTSDVRPGDNLWTSAVIALDPDDGVMRWAFQFTPNDAWDYDGNNALVLADVWRDGRQYKVIMQSNRNGYFYVLDRERGTFLWADPMVEGINWTKGLDPVTGRPVVDEAMRPRSGGPRVAPIVPSLAGGSNWFPMAFDPEAQIAFVPYNQWAMRMQGWPREDITHTPGQGYLGVDFGMYRTAPHIGVIKAYAVGERRVLWQTTSAEPLFAGMLSTAGGLIFTGDQLGFVRALDASSGRTLWRFQTGSGINASPVTYEAGGQQYVAVASGIAGDPQFYFSGPRGGMIYAFALDNLPAEDSDSDWGPDRIEGAVPALMP